MVLFILISCISSHREVNRFNARTHSEEVTGKDMYLNYQLTYCHKMWTRQHLFLNIFVPRDIIIPWFFYRGLAVISTVCILNGEMGWGGWGLEQICWQVNRKKSMFKFSDNITTGAFALCRQGLKNTTFATLHFLIEMWISLYAYLSSDALFYFINT